MRNINATALAEVQKRFGTEPIILLTIQWNSITSVNYSDIDGITGYLPRIASISGLDEIKDINNSNVTQTISLTLNDDDGAIKKIFDANNIHGRLCILKLSYKGLPLDKAFEIFRGRIVSPITWGEHTRQFSFDILSQLNSRQIGVTSDEAQYLDVPYDLADKAWPVCFGEVANVPATKVQDVVTGVAATVSGFKDPMLALKRLRLEYQLRQVIMSYNFYNNVAASMQSLIITATIKQQIVQITGDHASNSVYTLRLNNSVTTFLNVKSPASDLQAELDRISPDTYDVSQSGQNFIIDTKTDSQGNYLDTQPLLAETWAIKTGGNTQAKLAVYVTKYDQDGAEITGPNFLQSFYLRAVNLDSDYAAKIVQEDTKAQLIEDLVEQLTRLLGQTELIKELYEANPTNQMALKYNTQKVAVTTTDRLLYQASADMSRIQYDKQKMEVDIENLKIVYTTLSEIRQQLEMLIEYNDQIIQTLQKIGTLNEDQDEILVDWFTVSGSEKFDQGSIELLVNNVVLGGSLTLNRFTRNAIKPKHKNLKLGNREGPDPDTFWLQDDGIELRGMYAKLPSGYIIRITDQNGKECKFDLVTRDKDLSGRRTEVEFQPPQMQSIIQQLQNFLTGNETDQELIYIASTVPSKLSKKAASIVYGNNKVQEIRTVIPGKKAQEPLLKLALKPNVGTWRAQYNGRWSRDLSATIDVSDLESHLQADWGFSGIELIVTDLNDADGKKIGWSLAFNVNTMHPIEIDYGTTGYQTQAATYIAYYEAYIVSTGAHEHTSREIKKRIEKAIGESYHGPTLLALKNKINKFNELLTQVDTVTSQGLKKTVLGLQDQYNKLFEKVDLPKSVLAEAYQAISDQEQENLRDLALLQYFFWRQTQLPFTASLPDDYSDYYVRGWDFTELQEVAGTILPDWVAGWANLNEKLFTDLMNSVPENETYVINPGDLIRLNGDYQETWICNVVPSEVRSVYAYRTIKGVRRLVSVPRQYYTKDESADYGPYQVTEIKVRNPLNEIFGQDWENQIYVTLESSVGPNTADIMSWILSNYTDITFNTDSYNYYSAVIANYPMNFALLEKKDALATIQELAYQARSSAWVKGGELYVKYLPEEVEEVLTLNESYVETQTLVMTVTETEDLITKYRANWKFDYTSDKDYSIVLSYNVPVYMEREESYDYYAYTDYGLILKSATFWLIRRSNTWKRISFTGDLRLLPVEVNDTLLLDFSKPFFSNDEVKAIVEEATLNITDASVSISCWLPVRAGEMDKYKYAWPAGLTVLDIWPIETDIIQGLAGSPINDSVPNGIQMNLGISLSGYRPKNYGDITPTDVDDSVPTKLFDELSEARVSSGDLLSPVLPKVDLGNYKTTDVNFQLTAVKPKENPDISYGRIVGKDLYLSVPPNSMPGSADPAANLKPTPQFYEIRLNSGAVVSARCLQINEQDVIPNNTVVLVVNNKVSGQYEFQPPVYLYDGLETGA